MWISEPFISTPFTEESYFRRMFLNDLSGLQQEQPIGYVASQGETSNTVNVRFSPTYFTESATSDEPLTILQAQTASGQTVNFPPWTTPEVMEETVARLTRDELAQRRLVDLRDPAEGPRRALRAEGATRQDVENLLGQPIDPVEDFLRERMNEDDDG